MADTSYKISNFSKIDIGMTKDEVVRIVGDPTDNEGSGIVWDRYKLDDGWYIKLLFMGYERKLIAVCIVDYPNNRVFELKQFD